MPTKKPANMIEKIAAADTATYENTGDLLVVTQADGRRHEVSLRMPMRKMLTVVKEAEGLDAANITDPGQALGLVEDLMPAVLLDAEDLDFTEALAAFMNWAEALGERVGKALI